MNVSAKSEYGLRALVHLHRTGLSGMTPAREIAGACGVPLKYLEQILRVLKDGGLVEAQVGIAGGYRLSRPGSLITAGEAIRLLDERLGLGSRGTAGPPATDGLGLLWDRIESAIRGVVDTTTIADLAFAVPSVDRTRVAS
ncbi:MAG TPA: Rrf2 family transcriptional regulator [Gemmatimonadota bacterium]|nr:Rrf2 family transcriptional regulator [Gemmatimonadota bacterium]